MKAVLELVSKRNVLTLKFFQWIYTNLFLLTKSAFLPLPASSPQDEAEWPRTQALGQNCNLGSERPPSGRPPSPRLLMQEVPA